MTEVTEPKRPLYLGIDLGGTNIKAGVIDDAGRPLSSIKLRTEAERGPEHGVQRVCQAAREAVLATGLTLQDIEAVGVGSPGPMDLKEQILLHPHNLPGWINLPLAKLVADRLGLPAILQNDANAAAFGEFWVGAGAPCHSMVLFTLGTGIGCGIIVEGKILVGEHSHGGEAGHMRIAIDKPRRNTTGLYGSWEAYASATAVVDRTIEAIEAGETSVLRDHLAQGRKLSCRRVFETADQGDPLAMRIVDETALYLAIGACNIMHIIDPDMVAFSGGMIDAGKPFLERIRHYVRENALPVPATKTEITYATLGTEAGIIGAAGCARTTFGISR